MHKYSYPKLRRGNPHYYTIEAVDYCADLALKNCVQAVTPGVAPANFPYAAPVRYCKSQSDAYRLDTPSDPANSANPRCRKKYEEASGYVYPRYGQFRRVDITSTTTFDKRPLRTDCVNRPVCSYGEEMTNFANWFAYYRTRMLMMKSATGVAFSPIDARYRVGFVTINPDTPVKKDRFLKIDSFTPAQKKLWYDTLYGQEPRGGTPLPEALSRAGRYFAGVKIGINQGMDDDPMQFSCQQNFALLTTDGYWSGRGGVDENGKAIGNVDNDASKSPRPQYDGGKPFNPSPSDPEFSSAGTLADVALYYYQTDLRKSGGKGDTGADVSENSVPTSQKDNANWQHMVTFGLGMAEGLMDWRPDYESSDATGDFDNVRKGAVAGNCAWTPGTVCNWPMPGSRSPSNLDDLWHAAVNGRGQFFYARDTQAVQDSLNTALTNLNERNASGASAATSTPSITPTDRAIFLTAYTTIQWYGDVQARFINPNDGSVLPNVAWSARDKLQGVVAESDDQRTVYLADYDKGNGLKPFLFKNLAPAETVWFENKCDPVSNMTQCALLDPAVDRAAREQRHEHGRLPARTEPARSQDLSRPPVRPRGYGERRAAVRGQAALRIWRQGLAAVPHLAGAVRDQGPHARAVRGRQRRAAARLQCRDGRGAVGLRSAPAGAQLVEARGAQLRNQAQVLSSTGRPPRWMCGTARPGAPSWSAG